MPPETDSPHAHGADQLPTPTVEEVSPGIYAYIQLDGSWGLNNTGFITGSNAVSVIDTCFTEARTRAFLRAIGGVTDLHIRTLINTHHHGDHTHGNYLLPSASIVGHELCRQTVIDTGLHTLHPLFPGRGVGRPATGSPLRYLPAAARPIRGRPQAGTALHGTGPTPPTMSWCGSRSAVCSSPATSPSMAAHPSWQWGPYPARWVALERLRQFGAETIVPGHGPVCGTEVIDEMEAYLRFVQDRAKDAFAAGLSPLHAARLIDLEPFVTIGMTPSASQGTCIALTPSFAESRREQYWNLAP